MAPVSLLTNERVVFRLNDQSEAVTRTEESARSLPWWEEGRELGSGFAKKVVKMLSGGVGGFWSFSTSPLISRVSVAALACNGLAVVKRELR